MISVCINVDTRAGCDAATSSFLEHNQGCRSFDFLTHGIRNKKAFFEGIDHEIIAYIDETVRIPDQILNEMRDLCDCIVIRKHFTTYRGIENCGFANDVRYLHCLSQARGEIVVHFDADTACFAKDRTAVEGWLNLTNEHRFVIYPSQWSPRPVDDPSFGRHTWASTRAFACRREWLRFDDLEDALRNPQVAYERFGNPPRQCPWLEHFLALLNGESAYYPPRMDESMLMFCWSHYISGVLPALNARTYGEVLAYVNSCGGIFYPNDVACLNL